MLNFPSLFIGLRYTRSKRRNQFISFVSLFSLIGMALGTLSLIVVLSVMNGFNQEITQRILSVVPHGYINQSPQLNHWQQLSQQVESRQRVKASAPYIDAFVMLSSPADVLGVELQGILPEKEIDVSVMDKFIVHGEGLQGLEPGKFGIVLGQLVANFLGVGVGDSVLMTLPEISVTPAGLFPRVKRFRVVGTFQVGAQIDQSLAMIHIEDARRLLRKKAGAVNGLRLAFDDIYAAKKIIHKMESELGGDYSFIDWSQTQGSLFQAIKLEKRMVTLLLMIIIAVAALNIITSLILMVSDKRSDIAVLRTLGLSTSSSMNIFIVQGSLVGVIGILIGAILGIVLSLSISDLIAWLENTFGFYIFDPTVYFISKIPSELMWQDVVLTCSVGFILSILATLYPAYRASKVEPAEVLRYE